MTNRYAKVTKAAFSVGLLHHPVQLDLKALAPLILFRLLALCRQVPSQQRQCSQPNRKDEEYPDVTGDDGFALAGPPVEDGC